MNRKRGTAAAKGVTLTKHNISTNNVVEKLPENPTPEQLNEAAVTISLADLEERVADVRDSWETESLFEDVFEDLSNNNNNSNTAATATANSTTTASGSATATATATGSESTPTSPGKLPFCIVDGWTNRWMDGWMDGCRMTA